MHEETRDGRMHCLTPFGCWIDVDKEIGNAFEVQQIH